MNPRSSLDNRLASLCAAWARPIVSRTAYAHRKVPSRLMTGLMEGDNRLRRLLRSEFFRHGAVVLVASLVVNAFNYVLHLMLSRQLGVEGYGAFYAMLSALSLLGVPTNVLTMLVVRHAAELHASGNVGQLRGLARWGLLWTTVLGVVVFGVGVVVGAPAAAYLHIDDSRAVVCTALIVAFSIVYPSLNGILQGVEDFGRLAVAMIIDGVLKVGFSLGFAYLGWGVGGALLGYALGAGAAIGYVAIAVRSHFTAVCEPLHLDWRRLRTASAGITASSMAMAGLGFLDVLLVKHFFSPTDAGLYSAVSLVGKVLYYLIGFVPIVLLPKVTARTARGLSPLPVIAQAMLAIGVLCGSGLLVLAVAPAFVLRLMTGGAFLGAVPLVLPYACAMTLLGMVNILVTYEVGLHRFEFVPWLCVAVIGEVTAVGFEHHSPTQVVYVLLVGHAFALLATLYRVIVPSKRSANVSVGEAA